MQIRWDLVSLPSGRACQGETEELGTALEVEVVSAHWAGVRGQDKGWLLSALATESG